MKANKIIMLVIIMLLLTACDEINENFSLNLEKEKEQQQQQEQPVRDISSIAIAFESSDVLNPYRLKTLNNKSVSSLMYDSLIKLDPSYTVQYKGLASSIVMNGNIAIVKLKDEIYFEDGSPIRAEDVKYSLDMARGLETEYAFGLKNVDSSTVEDEKTLNIYLVKEDINFINLLTFPIIKEGEGLLDKPVSSGRYVKKGDKLVPNLNYGGVESKVKEINLVRMEHESSIVYSIQKNIIDMYFTADSSFVNGAKPVNYNNVNMNRLVYVGINNYGEYFSNPTFKQAINIAINREEINSHIYSSAGLTATSPFNPDFYYYEDESNYTILDSVKLLESIGYDEKDDEGYRMDGSERVSINILVHKDNSSKVAIANMIKDYLKSIGIEVIIDEQPYDEYISKLNNNEYDLYIAEVGIPDNMDISFLLYPNQDAGYGTVPDSEIYLNYLMMQSNEIDMPAFLESFEDNMPFIPLVYKNGILVYSKDLPIDVVATYHDIFYNIDSW